MARRVGAAALPHGLKTHFGLAQFGRHTGKRLAVLSHCGQMVDGVAHGHETRIKKPFTRVGAQHAVQASGVDG